MKTSTDTKNLVAAVHNVQQGLEIIERKSKADIRSQKGTSYTYKYADMPTIWLAIKPLLKENGLTVIQTPSSNNEGQYGDFLTTTIYHDSGEWMTDSMRLIISREDSQGLGASITYFRRYMLSAMLGIVTDDDNDATTQRLADGSMIKDWVRAFTIVTKRIDPEAKPTYNDFMKFMTDTYGKHPTKVLARESQSVLDTIQAFDPGISSEIQAQE